MACEHSGPHTGGSRLLPESRELQLVLVCDACGAESRQLGRLAYVPNPRRLVGHLAELTARALGLDEARVARVRFAALVCEVGRDQIPAEVLDKQGPLSEDEWRQVRRQPELAAAVLSDVSLDDIREWILCHRERPDGTGYPRGLAGEQIPLEARILAVTQAYVAMISDRPHRSRRTHEEACRELRRCAGTQFDERVAEAFMSAAAQRNLRLARAA